MTQACRVDEIKRWCCGFAILVGGLLGGCTSLPNTSGYTAATIQVRQAVATTGEVVQQELRMAIKAKATTADNESVKNLKAAWAATMKSLDAMVAHAQSIEQIVDAGNTGAESAKQLANSVKKLLDAVKVDAMSGASATLAQLSTDTVAFVYCEYLKHSAAKSLEVALDRFGPSMAKISALVQAQLGDARRLFVQQIAAQVNRLEQGGTGYGGWIKRNGQLNEEAEKAIDLLVSGIKNKKPKEVTKAKTTIADTEIGRKAIAPRLAEYAAKLNPIRQRGKAGRSILGAAENAVAAWGVAHQQLVKAVKERKPVTVKSLIAAVVELRALTQRWREL
ncbi:hypothetical protein JYT15_00680 [Acidimicrobium ferrooxidans]|nr:hypothetical protein [Acidimicrobium ferrooxidans]